MKINSSMLLNWLPHWKKCLIYFTRKHYIIWLFEFLHIVPNYVISIKFYMQVLESVWVYGAQLCGSALNNNIKTINCFQNKVLLLRDRVEITAFTEAKKWRHLVMKSADLLSIMRTDFRNKKSLKWFSSFLNCALVWFLQKVKPCDLVS